MGGIVGGYFSEDAVLAYLLLTGMTVLFYGAIIVSFIAAAESIRVLLDIQRNTQETAHYTRHS